MAITLSLHFIGIVMWLGGLMLLTRFLKVATVAAAPSPATEILQSMYSRVYYGFVLGGAVIALVTGIIQIMQRGVGAMMSQGWFHGKLTVVIFLIIVTALVGRDVYLASRGELVSKGRIIACHAIGSSCLVIIIFLTFVGLNR